MVINIAANKVSRKGSQRINLKEALWSDQSKVRALLTVITVMAETGLSWKLCSHFPILSLISQICGLMHNGWSLYLTHLELSDPMETRTSGRATDQSIDFRRTNQIITGYVNTEYESILPVCDDLIRYPDSRNLSVEECGRRPKCGRRRLSRWSASVSIWWKTVILKGLSWDLEPAGDHCNEQSPLDHYVMWNNHSQDVNSFNNIWSARRRQYLPTVVDTYIQHACNQSYTEESQTPPH